MKIFSPSQYFAFCLLTLFRYGCSDSERNHVANEGKTAGRYQFDTHPTGIGLSNELKF